MQNIRIEGTRAVADSGTSQKQWKRSRDIQKIQRGIIESSGHRWRRLVVNLVNYCIRGEIEVSLCICLLWRIEIGIVLIERDTIVYLLT